MKIGKSVVYFSINSSSSCRYNSLADVPYWSLYSRPEDCVQKEIGNQWRSDRALTFAELKQYLERYPGHRVLDAYPRKSPKVNISYSVGKYGNNIEIINKWTGEIYASFAIEQEDDTYTVRLTYLSKDAPCDKTYYYRKATSYLRWQI